MTLFQASTQEHLALAKHLTADVKTEEFVVGKGVVVKWERLRRQNHWFDALYNACAAGHYCGVRLVDDAKRPPKPRLALAEMGRMSNRPTPQELADRTRQREREWQRVIEATPNTTRLD